MARVSIYYDNDKKEQFFMVRGDERYARSTKTILELVSTDQEVLYFNAVFQVNVLRDVGEGSIVLRDNDVVVPVLLNINDEWVESEVIPWNSQLNGLTFKLNNLTYDVDHNLTAKYIGNKSCSPSLSNNLLVNVEDTHRTTPILTIDNTIQYDKNTTIVKTITLTNDLSETYNKNQEINVYYDDILINTVNTGETGTATVNIQTGEVGLHTIKLDYTGSNNLLPKTITQSVSIGYDLQVISYPEVMVQGVYQDFTFGVYDWFGNPMPSFEVILESDHGGGIDGDYTRTDGTVTFNDAWVSGKFLRRISHNTGVKTYYSDLVNPKVIMPTQLTVTTTAPRLYNDESNLLRVTTNSPYENTPIVLTGAVNETIYTGENGFVATKNLIGDGKGEKTITASFGDLTQTINLTDYIQYWSPNDIHPSPEQYVLNGGNLLKLNSYFRIDLDTLNKDFWFKLPVPKNKPFKLRIMGIKTNNPCRCYLALDNTRWNPGNIYTQFNDGTIEMIKDSENHLTVTIQDGKGNETNTTLDWNGTYIGFTMFNGQNIASNIGLNSTQLQCIFNQLYYYEG